MKLLIRFTLLTIALATCIFGVYYFVTLTSDGTNSIRYIEPEENYTSFADIINHPELKSKVIYVDLWHTGCGPCLKQFEYAPKLKTHYKDRSDLIFLYLGKDRSPPAEKFRWKRMIENKNLSGYHYFMSNDMYQIIWEETITTDTLIQAFPHYMIVDRNGKIINEFASRPSNDKVFSEIDQALAD